MPAIMLKTQPIAVYLTIIVAFVCLNFDFFTSCTIWLLSLTKDDSGFFDQILFNEAKKNAENIIVNIKETNFKLKGKVRLFIFNRFYICCKFVIQV